MRSVFFVLFLFSFFLLIHNSDAQESVFESVRVPTIVKEGTPGDILLEDSIVPPVTGSTSHFSGAGSILNSLENRMALPFSNYGRPGDGSQMRGLGISAEDVDVQAFGISLNPPQGGGFDLTAFPQFLWSDFRYQMGPSLNALNQKSPTGTLALMPWTAKALTGRSALQGRASGFYSSAGVSQVSAAATDSRNVAVVAGHSSYRVVGPSGGLSTTWHSSSSENNLPVYQGFFHLLATDQDSETRGSIDVPTPHARIRKIRVIPILQNDLRTGGGNLLKSSVFYDWAFQSYDDPGKFHNDIYSKQWGTENAYLVDQWKLGVSFRQTGYASSDRVAPIQSIANFQASPALEFGSILIEPTVQGVWANDFGWLPQGSLGLKKSWNQDRENLFSRFTYSNKIPSLLDRFSVANRFGYSGNPNLQVETDWTGTLGGAINHKDYEASLQGYVQYKKNTLILFDKATTNLGDAHMMGLLMGGKYHLSPWLEVHDNLTLSNSKIYATGNPFQYVPDAMNVFGVGIHARGEPKRWEWVTNGRFSGRRTYNAKSPDTLSGYLIFDTGATVEVARGISISGRIENIFERSIEEFRGYPIERTVSMFLMGRLN